MSILIVAMPVRIGQQIGFAAMCHEGDDCLFWDRDDVEKYARAKIQSKPTLQYEIAELTVSRVYLVEAKP